MKTKTSHIQIMDNILNMLHNILKTLRHFKNSETSFWEIMAYLSSEKE